MLKIYIYVYRQTNYIMTYLCQTYSLYLEHNRQGKFVYILYLPSFRMYTDSTYVVGTLLEKLQTTCAPFLPSVQDISAVLPVDCIFHMTGYVQVTILSRAITINVFYPASRLRVFFLLWRWEANNLVESRLHISMRTLLDVVFKKFLPPTKRNIIKYIWIELN